MKCWTRAFLILIALIFVFDAPLAEAARRRGRTSVQGRKKSGRTTGRRGRSSRRGTRTVRRATPPPDPRIAAREKRAREIADKAFADCIAIGRRFEKDEISQNYVARSCLALAFQKIETRVVVLMRAAGKSTEDFQPHADKAVELELLLKVNTYETMNDYDSLNLYYGIYTSKKAQLELVDQRNSATAVSK